MTDCEHAELSRQLALALGWGTVAVKSGEVKVHGPKCMDFEGSTTATRPSRCRC